MATWSDIDRAADKIEQLEKAQIEEFLKVIPPASENPKFIARRDHLVGRIERRYSHLLALEASQNSSHDRSNTKPKRKRFFIQGITLLSALIVGLAHFTGALDDLYKFVCRWTHWCSDERRAIAYLDWDGRPWRAEIKDQKFVLAAKDSLRDTQIVLSLRYLTWDRSPWEATINYGSFIHSPGGDLNRSHPDDVLHYLDWSGRAQTLRISETKNE